MCFSPLQESRFHKARARNATQIGGSATPKSSVSQSGSPRIIYYTWVLQRVMCLCGRSRIKLPATFKHTQKDTHSHGADVYVCAARYTTQIINGKIYQTNALLTMRGVMRDDDDGRSVHGKFSFIHTL
jgi:hypothetical protein